MERNAHYLIVGGFVAAVLMAAVVTLIWMAGQYDSATYKRYLVYFKGSVNGVSAGSQVSYRGVHVGQVVSIRFDPEHPERISTIIEVEESTPISTSSTVSLQAVGITGLSALAIKTEDTMGEPLSIAKGEKYAVIASERSGLDKLLSNAPQLTSSALETLTRINMVLNDDNLESINQAMDNMNQTMENIAVTSASLNLILNEKNANSIERTLQNVEASSSNLNAVLNKKNAKNVEQTLQNVEASSSNLNALFSGQNTKNIEETLQNLDNITTRLDNILSANNSEITKFTGENLDEIGLLVKDMREMVSSYKLLGQKLSDDPSQIIYKPNYKGVKVER